MLPAGPHAGHRRHACRRDPFLVDRGADDITAITLIAAPEGIAHVEQALSALPVPLSLVTGAVDERLNERGYIVPGLGDAGDRLYGVV